MTETKNTGEEMKGYIYRVYSEDQFTFEFNSCGLVTLCDECEKTYEETKNNENHEISIEHWEPITEATECSICDCCLGETPEAKNNKSLCEAL